MTTRACGRCTKPVKAYPSMSHGLCMDTIGHQPHSVVCGRCEIIVRNWWWYGRRWVPTPARRHAVAASRYAAAIR